METRINKIKQYFDTSAFDSEESVRTHICYPVLRELGWDVESPVHLIPEYKVSNLRVDIALCRSPGKPAARSRHRKLQPVSEGAKSFYQYKINGEIQQDRYAIVIYLKVLDYIITEFGRFEELKLQPINHPAASGRGINMGFVSRSVRRKRRGIDPIEIKPKEKSFSWFRVSDVRGEEGNSHKGETQNAIAKLQNLVAYQLKRTNDIQQSHQNR